MRECVCEMKARTGRSVGGGQFCRKRKRQRAAGSLSCVCPVVKYNSIHETHQVAGDGGGGVDPGDVRVEEQEGQRGEAVVGEGPVLGVGEIEEAVGGGRVVGWLGG